MVDRLKSFLYDRNIDFVDSATALVAYARDLYPFMQIPVLFGNLPYQKPELVVQPVSERDVVELVKFADREGVKIIPYGAGSGVCGATLPLHREVIVDMKRLNRILEIDRTNNVVVVEPGIIGERLEHELNFQGYTLGHFPSSIYCSSAGGWVAARSAGQQSTFYGKIEDMLVGFRGVLPDGSVVDTGIIPGGALTPMWHEVFAGSEGTMIIFTRLYFRIYPLPEKRSFLGFRFKNVERGLNAMRKIIQSGIKPSVMRLYDELDTLMVGSGEKDETARKENFLKEKFRDIEKRYPGLMKKAERYFLKHGNLAAKLINIMPGDNLLVLMFEGVEEIVDAETEAARRICVELGGRDMGEAPGRSWYETRYHVSYKQSPVYFNGGFVDTMEVATTWDNLPNLYHGMRKAFGRHVLVMAHFSHAYYEGANIYFTFAAYRENQREAEELYRKVWNDALKACTELGGTITHHHGVGILKAAFMSKEWGGGFEITRAIKRVLDPKEIFNPGKLGL